MTKTRVRSLNPILSRLILTLNCSMVGFSSGFQRSYETAGMERLTFFLISEALVRPLFFKVSRMRQSIHAMKMRHTILLSDKDIIDVDLN